MRLAELYQAHRPLFSIELFPPKTPEGVENLKGKLREIAVHRPHMISVTYGAGGGTRHTTREICAFIKQDLGIEAMAHLTCAAHSREEIHAVLEGLRAEGIDNVMALRGDPPKGAAEFTPAEGGFRHAIELVRAIGEEGGFGVGVAGYPEGHGEAASKDADLRHQVEKIQAGADLVISQFFLDNTDFLQWRDALRGAGVRVPIVPGILPALSAKQITGFAGMCGVRVPPALMAGLERYAEHPESAAAFGLVFAQRQVEQLLAEGVDGIHLYALNRLESIRAVSAQMESHAGSKDAQGKNG